MSVSFVAIDYIFFVIVFIFAMVTLIKGFVDEIFGKAALVLGILFGLVFYNELAKYLLPSINNVVICNILAFLILFVGVFILVKIVGAILGKIFQIRILKSLDRTLGFAFGVIEGLAIVALIIFILNIQPFFDPRPILKESFFYHLLNVFYSSPTFQELTSHV